MNMQPSGSATCILPLIEHGGSLRMAIMVETEDELFVAYANTGIAEMIDINFIMVWHIEPKSS